MIYFSVEAGIVLPFISPPLHLTVSGHKSPGLGQNSSLAIFQAEALCLEFRDGLQGQENDVTGVGCISAWLVTNLLGHIKN